MANIIWRNQGYINCLAFRDTLYELKRDLYNLVKDVFRKFRDHLNNTSFGALLGQCRKHTCMTLTDNKIKFTLFSKDDWYQQLDGWRIIARIFDKHFPESGEYSKVDVTTLLNLICVCRLFRVEHGIPNELHTQTLRVKILRDTLYGHIPELSIPQEQFHIYPIGETNFEKIMQELIEFDRKLCTLKLSKIVLNLD